MADLTDFQLRQLAAAATPGPWEAWFSSHGDPYVVEAGRGVFGAIAGEAARGDLRPAGEIVPVSTAPDDYGRANCEYIAAVSPDVVLRLLDRIAALGVFG